MKVTAIIPARLNSSRLTGKPLADICGKPMIWWVYQQAQKAAAFADIMVATEDPEIEDACAALGMNCFRNQKECPNVVNRLFEVSQKIDSDYYLCINGDEPIIESDVLTKGIPNRSIQDRPVMFGIMRKFTDPAEVMDPGNLKLVTAADGRLIYSSRSPIPFPQNGIDFCYQKYIGVECYNQAALDFYVHAEMGVLEKIEGIGTLRFLEYGHPVYYTLVESSSLSVDTAKDLEVVRRIISERLCTERK